MSKYTNLSMSKEARTLWFVNPQKFKSFCNGVGSQVGWASPLYHLIPNTIWFLDITPASDIHDVEYSHPTQFITRNEALLFKEYADERFYQNMLILIERKGGWMRKMRLRRAKIYYYLVLNCGEQSFLKNKDIII